MKKAIIMLACMLATALQAQNTTCDTVRNFPWSDGFDLGIACWTVPAGSNWMFFDPSAGGALLNSYIQSNSQPVGTDNWIVSRPIALPAVDSMNLVLEWGDGNYDDEDYPYRYSVLVTTSADPLAATAVWDTLYHVDGDTLVYNSSQSLFTRRQADLTAYAGQTVRLAFRHQPVVSVPNSYGLLRLCIDNVTVREMHPCVARAVPWSEDFASDSTRECWPDLIYYDYMGIPSARVWHHLLVSPAFDMPAIAPDVQLRWAKQYSSVSGSRTLVLVSPTGGQDEADFTDTIYNVVNANLGYASDSVLLGQAYAGQRIRVAFGVSSGYLVLSDVAVNNTTASPSVTLTAPAAVRTGDSVHFTASPGHCAQSGLSFSWHSTLLDSTITLNSILLTLNYPLPGIDTVTVVVSNLYGADSAVAVVQVVDCSPRALPYYEDFESVPATASSVAGHLPLCWDYSWNGMGAADAPHVITPGGYQYVGGLPSKALYMTAGYAPEGYGDPAEVLLPSFADSLQNLAIAFDYRFESASHGTLQVGYYDDTVFTAVQTMIPHAGSYRRDTVRFAGATVADGPVALRWSYGNIYYYYAVLVDNIEVFPDSNAVIDTLPVPPDTLWRTVTLLCDSSMGTVTGGGLYADSSTVALTAIAFEGYHFVTWSDGDTLSVRSILLVSDTILTAYFVQDTLPTPPLDTLWRTVTVTANVAGTCETYGSGVYADSSTVEIGYHVLDTTTEGGHWQFLGWSDGVIENPRDILVTSDTAFVVLCQWVADSVGIEEIEKLELKIEIFPNPTSGKVTVTSPEPLVAATLTDLQGRREEVKLTAIGHGQYSLDLTTSPQGVYLLTLTTADGRQHTVRLLKQSDIFGN